MRIAFITQNYIPTDGLGRVTMGIAEEIGKTHDVHVYTRQWVKGAQTNVKLHKVPALTQKYSVSTLSFFFTSWLRLLPVRWMYDIVHVQGWSFTKPEVFTVHVVFKAAIEEHTGENRDKIVEKTGTEVSLQRRIEMMRKFLEYNFAKRDRYKKLVPVSVMVENDLIKTHDIPKEDIRLIPNGVDTDYFHPDNKKLYRSEIRKKHGIPEDCFLFFFNGNDPKRKGLITAVEGFIEADIKDSHLLIIGRNPYEADAFEPLKKLISDSGFDDRTTFLDNVPDNNQYFAAADVFVFPSVYETYGLVVIEAMGTGIPVITSRTGEFPVFVNHGENGFLLKDAFDVEGMARYMTQLYNDRDLVQKMGIEGRKKALEYSWVTLASQTVKLYEEILANGK